LHWPSAWLISYWAELVSAFGPG